MAEKKMPLIRWYENALHNEGIHACTSMELTYVDVETLFVGKNALLFIRNYFESLRTSYALQNPAKKFLDIMDRITEFRAQHTVASFLLGITVKEELALDMRNWIRIYDTKSSDATFGFFWSLICLTHDVAYHWERNSSKLLINVPTADSFCQHNKIEYNLLDQTAYADLIRKYYRCRAETGEKKIDHGIAGAILIYDALMSFYYEGKKLSSPDLCGLKLRNNFPDFCLRIAETVALHNMWRATSKTIDTYKEYQLYALIPDGSGKEFVLYKDDALLFLLCLIDTIDPIKAFCSTEGNRHRIPVDQVLDSFFLQLMKRSGSKKLRLEFLNPYFVGKYTSDIKNMETWLGVTIKNLGEYEREISIWMASAYELSNYSNQKSA